jgi:hypothetical protein
LYSDVASRIIPQRFSGDFTGVIWEIIVPSKRPRLNQPALNRSIIVDLGHRKVSRRDLFAGGAAAAASLSPGVRATVAALGVEPVTVEFVRQGKNAKVIVSTSSGGSWAIDTAQFAGSPTLTSERGEKETSIILKGARYPGTQIALNFEVSIPDISTGRIEFNFFECGDGTASFKAVSRVDPFLKGESSATNPIDKANINALFRTLQPGAGLIGLSRGTVTFSAAGELLATAPMELTVDENVWATSELGVSSQSRTNDTIVLGRDKIHSVVRAVKRDRWDGVVAMESTSGWQVKGDVDAFETITAECHENGQVAVTFTGGGSLDVTLPGVATLKTQAPTLTCLGALGDDLHFVSMLEEHGSWLHHDGISIQAAPVASEPFIFSTNKFGNLVGEPALHSRSIAVDLPDAVVSFATTRLPNLSLVSEPQGRPPLNQRPPVIQRPPVTQIPKVTDKKPDIAVIASTQTWIPSIEVVRPDDFLHLKFEFANLHLVTSVVGLPYFEREYAARPAYVVVEFPPQSIGEQTLPSNSVAKTPIRTLLSGPTRLVFYIPSSQKSVKFSLSDAGGLLDWSAWSLSVAPAAFSTFSGKVSIDPSWQHPIQDVKIGANREFELFAERSPTTSERLASLFKIQRQTTDQIRALPPEFQMIRQKPITLIHFKPTVLEVKPQIDPTKVIPGIPKGRTGPVYRYNTNIEIPAMMQMSPDENAHFFHVRSPRCWA